MPERSDLFGNIPVIHKSHYKTFNDFYLIHKIFKTWRKRFVFDDQIVWGNSKTHEEIKETYLSTVTPKKKKKRFNK